MGLTQLATYVKQGPQMLHEISSCANWLYVMDVSCVNLSIGEFLQMHNMQLYIWEATFKQGEKQPKALHTGKKQTICLL